MKIYHQSIWLMLTMFFTQAFCSPALNPNTEELVLLQKINSGELKPSDTSKILNLLTSKKTNIDLACKKVVTKTIEWLRQFLNLNMDAKTFLGYTQTYARNHLLQLEPQLKQLSQWAKIKGFKAEVDKIYQALQALELATAQTIDFAIAVFQQKLAQEYDLKLLKKAFLQHFKSWQELRQAQQDVTQKAQALIKTTLAIIMHLTPQKAFASKAFHHSSDVFEKIYTHLTQCKEKTCSD